MLTKEHLKRLAKVLPQTEWDREFNSDHYVQWDDALLAGGDGVWIETKELSCLCKESNIINGALSLMRIFHIQVWVDAEGKIWARAEDCSSVTGDTLTEAVVLAALDAAEKEESNG
jgi:hypothetical protein